MRKPFYFNLLLALTLGFIVFLPGFSFAQNNLNIRRARLRSHEKRIQQIIDERRKQKKLEEERRQEQLQQAAENAGLNEDTGEEIDSQTLVELSTVVMGLQFLEEDGASAYNAAVAPGEKFVTEVYLFNVDQNPVDRVRLAIDFDKRFIEPIRVFDTTLRSFMESEPKFEVETRDAVLVYDAELARPLSQPQPVLLKILWEAKRETPFTGIDFAFSQLERDEDIHTAIYARGKNILGSVGNASDGVLSGGLMITDPEKQAKPLQGKAEELKDIYLGSVAADSAVGLQLIGPQEIEVGQPFRVRVRLNNPEGALIDALNFAILFDSSVLQAIDKDKFNFVIRGVNIHDGPYHRNFPWDMHKRNEIRNDRGLALYQMSLSNGGALPTEVFADLYFLPIAPTTSTDIGFVKSRPGAPDLTSVRYFGYEKLDLKSSLSFPTIRMRILPANLEVATQETLPVESEVAEQEDLSVRDLRIER